MAVYHRTQRLQIYGEKPEVTKLFGDRYRMVVRCKAARDTEAWYNANKDQIFASFGTLYSAQMSVDGIDPRVGEAYPDMCLVSNSASYTQTGEYVITFVYETLTAVWTKDQEDKVTSVANGLRVIDRSEVAKVDGFPIVQLSGLNFNTSKVVLSGMGNASNYFVLLVKADSANTIYWRATNEASATQTGSFTTASTDQWEYKVIYTPISIDQLEIGYDGTNYSTFDLSEFYLVSQSSDWQNNIVESFIEFEVTVDNPSSFNDTVVFTGSNGNTATGTNVQGGGTGSVSSPYDEDDVGVATINDGGKTLYLAGFRDETSTNPDFQIGRFITTWTEAGLISESRRSIGQGIYSVSKTFLAQEGSTTGPVISRETRDIDGLKVISVTTYQDSAGNSIAATDGSDNLVHSFDTEENFTIPGVVRIRESSYRSGDTNVPGIGLVPQKTANYGFDLVKPAVTLQRVRNYIFYTTDPYISDSDYQYNPGDGAAVGHWNPVDWAKSTISGVSANGSPFYESKAYGNYRAANATREFTSSNRNARYGYINAPYRLTPTLLRDDEGNYIRSIFINGYKVAREPAPMISVEGGPENPVGLRWTLSVAVGSTPSFEDLNGNSYYKKVIKICDVDGEGIDEELLYESSINKLGSYSFTDEGSDFYSIALHESYQEVDDFYNGNEIHIPFRSQTLRNEYIGFIKSMIYDYDSSTNKILIKSSTILYGNYPGKYTGNGVDDINNFDTPRFTMIEHSTASKIVRIQNQENFGTSGGSATIIFDPAISTRGLDHYNIQFTSGECSGLTAPIQNHWANGTGGNASYLLKIDCSNASFNGLSLAIDDTFVLVSPESFT